MRPALLALHLLFVLTCAFADEAVDGVTVDVFNVAASGGTEQKSAGSPGGVSVVRDRFEVLGKSIGIPLVKGQGFAVKFTLAGKHQNLEDVRLVVNFPEMKAPTGEVYSKIDRIQKSRLIEGTRMVLFSYTFDESWELVEGLWTVQIFQDDKKLAEAELMTYKPE